MPMVNILAKAGESFIVTDPKGEIYAQTSGLAKEKGYKIVVLNFRDLGKGDMWNPLSIPYEMWCAGQRDDSGLLLSDFVSTIADEQVKVTKDAFWPQAAQSVAIANLYVLMEAAKKEEINLTSFTFFLKKIKK
jgi:type IV secretion system protein VirD4